MLVAGIVCEYNPLHTGHAHHLRATRRAGAQAIVCVMSGHFVQRAEPAMLTKWTRAQAAVLCGADLVLELPSRCALQSAEGFAQSAVQLLLAAGRDRDLTFRQYPLLQDPAWIIGALEGIDITLPCAKKTLCLAAACDQLRIVLLDLLKQRLSLRRWHGFDDMMTHAVALIVV